ncbi:hypothetical protein GYMLUDRAFT_154660 [Collybiopsis luxurians FD-317 M1]|nr:hypothetical protein GYMLUDRAFT_154660 [Collybiopsis luxurians FD-317 M1]
MQSHPAIAHLAKSATTEADSSSDSHKLWTDKWHPSRADHVLGNEEQATFLRQWLSALEVHFDPAHEVNNADQSQDSGRVRQTKESAIIGKRGTKRRNIIRAVEKRPGRKRQRIDSDDDDDSWIVDSDDIEEDESQTVETLEEAEKPLETRPRSSHRFSGQNPVPNRAFDRLTNTILLSGPRSSGKTSAVYACAEELGWEVFEVYPGVGKRSGANLDNLVGEVGKNHLVRKRRFRNVRSGTNTKADGSLTSAFARGKEKEMLDDHREGSPPAARFIEELDDPPMEVHQSHETLPRQSLILLEEVDILFKDDTNFWGSLINLIRDCKRPVILTCNDTSLVPLAELPLQNVLNFRPCPTPVATSFLLALCCAEGYLLERDAISRFYEHPGSLDATGDLRQAIHNLQFWCPEKTQGGWTARCYQDSLETEDMLYWEWPDIGQSSDVSTLQAQATDSIGDREVYHADLISFADCYLLRNAVDTPKVSAFGNSSVILIICARRK